MHPEMLAQIIQDRGRDMQARAAEDRLARGLFKARRARRRGDQQHTEQDSFVMPAIPDYVGGSLCELSTAGTGDSASTGHVTRHAA
jgi:hypothetical protein